MTEAENKFAIERFERPSACPVCQGEMKPMMDVNERVVIHRVQVGSAQKAFTHMSMMLAYKLCATCCYQQAFNVTAMGLDR